MNNILEPNLFKMRHPDDMPKWKQLIWKTFGKKQVGYAEGYMITGYWLRGICLIAKWELDEQSKAT